MFHFWLTNRVLEFVFSYYLILFVWEFASMADSTADANTISSNILC